MQDTRQVSEPWVGYPGYGQAPEPVGRASQLRAGILSIHILYQEAEMKTEIVIKNGTEVAVIESDELLITDIQSALDLIMTVKYETGCTNIAVNKEAVTEEFFVLSTCLAGEVLQKFVNYGIRFAVYGDFTNYTSKPLKDFMYESNRGNDIYFQPSASLAVDKLCGVPSRG